MKKWVGIFSLLLACSSWRAVSQPVQVCGVGIDLHDAMFIESKNPIEVWRKMRPQDFIGAPTVWQVIV